MLEEKKDETPETKKPVEEESDFADEAKPVSAPVEEKPVEEKKPEQPKVDLFAEKEAPEAPAEVAPAKGKAPEVKYDYVDEDLQAIETARVNFFKIYKKQNLIKWIVTGIILVAILGTWLGVTLTGNGTQNWATVTILVVVAVAVIGLGVYSVMFRKKIDKAMKGYFADYYKHNNHYVYGDQISSLTGTVDDKLDASIFNAAGLYKNVAKVGSRDCLHFNLQRQSHRDGGCRRTDQWAKEPSDLLRWQSSSRFRIPMKARKSSSISKAISGLSRRRPWTTIKSLKTARRWSFMARRWQEDSDPRGSRSLGGDRYRCDIGRCGHLRQTGHDLHRDGLRR
jgi:uncharacterized membrane protein (DUF485 family)